MYTHTHTHTLTHTRHPPTLEDSSVIRVIWVKYVDKIYLQTFVESNIQIFYNKLMKMMVSIAKKNL